MPRLFVDVSSDDTDRATVDADGVRHLRALRLGPGDGLEAIVGPGEVRLATIETLGKRGAKLRLGESVHLGAVDPGRPLILAVGLADFSRFDSVVEKATELGATHIVPLRTARTQIGKLTDSRRQRWHRIARAACEQCGRTQPPEISAEIGLDDVRAHLPKPSHRVVLSPDGERQWDGETGDQQPLVLFVGPEGGFTTEEVQALCRDGAHARTLGPRILRFETAAAAALAIAGTRRP